MSQKNASKKKRRVFLTGATGTMGSAALKEFIERLDKFSLIVLARDSKKNRKFLSPYLKKGIEVVWGDLLNYENVLKGVEGADVVLHAGGMVSPAADYHPMKTFKVNTVSMKNIIDAVKSQSDPDSIAVVYIGSVAQYGSYNPPNHWGRCGDLLLPAKMDGYALSKVAAERLLSDSGLKKWVSLRQTGILSPALLNNATDPIAFHVPIKGVLEWITVEDSGRLLANVAEEIVADNFWCKFYNIGGGSSYRLTNYEFEASLMKAMKCPPPEKVFDVRWFATDNFHGMWYEDSDALDRYLHFRSGETSEEYFKRFSKSLPFYYSLTPMVPSKIMKMFMRWVAGRNKLAPLYWKKHGNSTMINLYFGSLDKWNALPGWKETDLSRPSDKPESKNHGYDESKPLNKLTLEDMKEVASFRGGECVSDHMVEGDLLTLLEWKTENGEEFTASPASVVLGGHWGNPITEEEIREIQENL